MLSELSDLQESEEDVWGQPQVSFNIRTRETDEGEPDELIERDYTFQFFPEVEEWVFHEYEEHRSPDPGPMTKRNWRRVKHIDHLDGESPPGVNIPPEVNQKLEDLLDLKELHIREP